MSTFRGAGPVVRLHERFTVTGPGPGLTLATTKRGPTRNSGCGLEARNTWPWLRAGTAIVTQRTAARATHEFIMERSSAKVRLRRRPDRDSEQLAHFFPPRTLSACAPMLESRESP